MIAQLRKRTDALPHIAGEWIFGLGTVAGFVWLLAHDAIHPLAIYLLQVYLTF